MQGCACMLVAVMMLLASCREAAPEPKSLQVTLFWPAPGMAAMWCSVRDASGEPMAVEGTATVELWELVPSGDSLIRAGTPLFESTSHIGVDSFSPSAEECRPCSLAGMSRVAPIGTFDLAWLVRKPTQKMGLVEVSLVLDSGLVLIDTVEFAFPE